jgi:hypothetical protein
VRAEVRRFRRVNAVVAPGVVAFVVAALTFVLVGVVVHPSSPKLALTSGTGTSITSEIFDSPACSGAPANLYPGTTHCLVFTVHNSLTVPVTVQSITMSLDGGFPALPSGCPPSDFSFPSFTGSLVVPGRATADSPGLPITMQDSGTNQDNCQNTTLHFVYSSVGQFTDSTTTSLSVSPNPPVAGQPVTFTTTVTAGNPSADPTSPTGVVNFFSCSGAACTDPVLMGTRPVGPSGDVTFTTTLSAGGQFFEATFEGTGTDFAASTSGVFGTTVSPSTSPSGSKRTTTGIVPTAATAKSVGVAHGTPLAFTGADLAALIGGGLILVILGALLVVHVRRRFEAGS